MPSADHHPEDEVSRRRRRLAIAVLIIFNLTSYNGVMGVFSPRLREYFSLTYEQWGTMSGLGSLGQTVSLLLVGLVIARFGVRRITELSLGGVGACFLLIGQGANLLALRVSLFFQGLFSGFSRSSLPAYLVALYPSHKRRMISLQLTCGSVMGIVIPLWADQLLKWSREGGHQELARLFFSPFLVAGCVVLCGWALLSFSRQPDFQSVQTPGQSLRLRPLLGIRPLAIVLLITLHASADGTMYEFLPMFMDHQFKELLIPAGMTLAGHNVAYLITRSLLSVLPEGLGQRAILTLAGPIGGSLLLVMLWQGNAISVPLIYFLASLFFAAEFPVLLSEISSPFHGPLRRGHVRGLPGQQPHLLSADEGNRPPGGHHRRLPGGPERGRLRIHPLRPGRRGGRPGQAANLRQAGCSLTQGRTSQQDPRRGPMRPVRLRARR